LQGHALDVRNLVAVLTVEVRMRRRVVVDHWGRGEVGRGE
jgi:hypothetical protein